MHSESSGQWLPVTMNVSMNVQATAGLEPGQCPSLYVRLQAAQTVARTAGHHPETADV